MIVFLKKSKDVKKLKETTKDKVKKYFIYESKKCKGISKHTVKKGTRDDYRDTLFSSTGKKTLYEINEIAQSYNNKLIVLIIKDTFWKIKKTP